MKKNLFLLLVIATTTPTLAQNGITFSVEELSKPAHTLRIESSEEVYRKLIQADVNLDPFLVTYADMEIPYGIVTHSNMPDSLVNFGYHSFFNGMYQAYADHRPFVISPDMIWLLISQGFAHHVNASPELLRDLFVDFTGKRTLVISSENITLESTSSEWEGIFPKFEEQLSLNTKENLIDILSAGFSTTTCVERIASQITVMEVMKPYFEFVHITIVCGIPEITLKGTPDDWKKIREKARALASYDLQWWISELDPLLEGFIDASEGKIDRDFWRNMFKYHTEKRYGSPKRIDGWIIKFFPYDKEGNRNDLQQLSSANRLPEEIVKVDLKHIQLDDDGHGSETMLELWAGFFGLDQDRQTYALTPRIGWMIRKKDTDQTVLRQSIRYQNDNSGIYLRVAEVPVVVLELKKIRKLSIDFTGGILIPDQMQDLEIGNLILNGEISREGVERLKNMFPASGLIINGETIQRIIPR